MARQQFQHGKRQRELAKKQKREEKMQKRLDKKHGRLGDAPPEGTAEEGGAGQGASPGEPEPSGAAGEPGR